MKRKTPTHTNTQTLTHSHTHIYARTLQIFMSFLSKDRRGSFLQAIKRGARTTSKPIIKTKGDEVVDEEDNKSTDPDLDLIIEEVEIDSNSDVVQNENGDVHTTTTKNSSGDNDDNNEKDEENKEEPNFEKVYMNTDQPIKDTTIDENKQVSFSLLASETFEINPSSMMEDDDKQSASSSSSSSQGSLSVSQLFDQEEDDFERLMRVIRGDTTTSDTATTSNNKNDKVNATSDTNEPNGEKEEDGTEQTGGGDDQNKSNSVNESPANVHNEGGAATTSTTTTTIRNTAIQKSMKYSNDSAFLTSQEAENMIPPPPFITKTTTTTTATINSDENFHDDLFNTHSRNKDTTTTTTQPFISEIQITSSEEREENEIHECIYSRSSPNRSVYKETIPNYKPISSWIGRLIFNCEKRTPGYDDGVTIEIEHAPYEYQHLIGQILPLRWNMDNPNIQSFVRVTTKDVKLTNKGRQSLESNEYLKPPARLHYRFGVGPLESLAGSRLDDNVHVMLPEGGVTVKPVTLPSSFQKIVEEKKDDWKEFSFGDSDDDDRFNTMGGNGNDTNQFYHHQQQQQHQCNTTTPTTIYLDDHPIQVTGVYYCVVIIIERVENDLFKVKHYNSRRKKFDGPTDIIRLPQAKELRFSNTDTAIPSTNVNIEKSPENRYGWYLYGSFVREDYRQDRFVVEALEPFRALCLDPVEYIEGGSRKCCMPKTNDSEATRFIHNGNFDNLKDRTGTLSTTLIDLNSQMRDDAVEMWKEGDVLLVVQCAGGMKSDTYKRDVKAGLAVSSHFAYGFATVMLDPLTDQLRFDIEYIQVYATTTLGVISGAMKRHCFLGCLDTGNIGVRPVSDVLIKLDTITNDYIIGPKYTCSPLQHFKYQLHLMAARYRVGDGLGVVNMSTKSNSTQDSNQALYVAMKQAEESLYRRYKELKRQHESSWDFDAVVMVEEDSLRFTKLKNLCAELRSVFAPYGIVHVDWKHNAHSVVLVENTTMLGKGRTSHKTFFPRRAFDDILKVFLRNDAKLWFVTTVIVGGESKNVVPLKPAK